jgi:hypothetical protein
VSDFDDEPAEGLEATDGPAVAAAEPAPARKPRPQPDPDDDWDDDWDDDDDGGRGGGKRDLTLVYAIVIAAIVIVVAVVLTRPKDDNSSNTTGGGNTPAGATTEAKAPEKNWQGAVGDAAGEAQKRAESGPGIYIWTDFTGWHLRQNGDAEVKVAVVAPQVRTGGDDSEFKEQAEVTLPAGNGSQGADLDLGSSETAAFTVTVNGANVPADQIFLGGAEGVADQNPVSFVKS